MNKLLILIALALACNSSCGNHEESEVIHECGLTSSIYYVEKDVIDDTCGFGYIADESFTVLNDGSIVAEITPEGCEDSPPLVFGCLETFTRVCKWNIHTDVHIRADYLMHIHLDERRGNVHLQAFVPASAGPTRCSSHSNFTLNEP